MIDEGSNQVVSCDIDEKKCCGSNNESSVKKNFKSHWNQTYETSPSNKLGWFEEISEPSLHLLSKCNLEKTASILNVGTGTSNYVDELLNQNYRQIIVNDISSVALNKLRNRLNEEDQKGIQWIQDDLTNPTILNSLDGIDLWHDRAVLHFFQDVKDQDSYFNLLKRLVKLNGYVILAEFSLDGAEKCSGLPVFRYSDKMLEEKLGRDFNLIESFIYTYHMPSGDSREYVYTLFKRIDI